MADVTSTEGFHVTIMMLCAFTVIVIFVFIALCFLFVLLASEVNPFFVSTYSLCSLVSVTVLVVLV